MITELIIRFETIAAIVHVVCILAQIAIIMYYLHKAKVSNQQQQSPNYNNYPNVK